jgi:nitrous oxidase accessory protein NosD
MPRYERGCQVKKDSLPQEDADVVIYIQPHLILRGVVGLVALARTQIPAAIPTPVVLAKPSISSHL